MARGERTNPSVNRCLKDEAMDHIDHALGRPVDPMGETYRNRFATDGKQADEFAASPHWEEYSRHGDMRFFGVTDAGRTALSEHLSRLPRPHRKFEVTFEEHTWICAAQTAAKAKYQEWLSVSDCWSELTFGEFCRGARVRRAA